MSWDGSFWTSYGPAEGAAPPQGVSRTGLQSLPDGTFWFGTLAVIEGTSLRQVLVPASAGNRKPAAASVALAADGNYWVAVIDSDRRGPPRCPRATLKGEQCQGTTDGLYVITPEAVAATE